MGEGASGPDTTGGEADAGDQDARRIVLQQSDFPAGWTSTPSEPDDAEDDGGSMDELERCLGRELSEDEGSVGSPAFAQGDVLQAASEADVVASVEVVEADWAALGSAKMLPCLEARFDAELERDGEEGVEFSEVKAEKLDYPKVGDDAMAVRLATSVIAEGDTVPVFIDVVFIRKGRAEIQLTLTGLGDRFPAALAADLGRAIADRA